MRARVFLHAFVAASAVSLVFAQQDRAPRETVTALLKGKKVSVDYGRPALKGRTMDALLAQLPPDRVWRAGANQVTTFTAETDVVIGGVRVPAGKYSAYLHLPETGPASLILNSDPGVPLKVIYAQAPPALADELWPRLDGYEKIKATEVARIPLKSVAPREPMERFLVSLEPARDGVSAVTFTWGDRAWTAEVRSVG